MRRSQSPFWHIANANNGRAFGLNEQNNFNPYTYRTIRICPLIDHFIYLDLSSLSILRCINISQHIKKSLHPQTEQFLVYSRSYALFCVVWYTCFCPVFIVQGSGYSRIISSRRGMCYFPESIKGGGGMSLLTSYSWRPHEQVWLLVPTFCSGTFCICWHCLMIYRLSLLSAGAPYVSIHCTILECITNHLTAFITRISSCVQENVCSPDLYPDAASGAVRLCCGGWKCLNNWCNVIDYACQLFPIDWKVCLFRMRFKGTMCWVCFLNCHPNTAGCSCQASIFQSHCIYKTRKSQTFYTLHL